MRRMYSVQELSNIISSVIQQEVADGTFDAVISGAVNDYLEEHPVDITALEGLDISVGSLDADGLVTGAEIVEKMTGYSFTSATPTQLSNLVVNYAGVVKNGNKLTYVLAMTITIGGTDIASNTSLRFGKFIIPASVLAKLIPYSQGSLDNVLEDKIVNLRDTSSVTGVVQGLAFTIKATPGIDPYIYPKDTLVAGKSYHVRIESTFLLSDSLA